MNNVGQPYGPEGYLSSGTVDADIDAPEAWDINHGSQNVIVAVIDTGIDYNHEDLAANIWHNYGEIPHNGIDDDGNGFVDDYLGWNFFNHTNDPFDDYGHGTHVAGIIGAVGNNGIGVAGVSWKVKLMPLKFIGFNSGEGWVGTDADAISAIDYAIMMKADIMSNSWGGSSYSHSLREAIESANTAGILFVAAAGNIGFDNDLFPEYPSSYDNDNIISVAAISDYDHLARFSNYGHHSVDIAAPGTDILSTVPKGTCPLCNPPGYRFLDGTSMAAPHVSGAAAIIKAQFPFLDTSQIKSKILYFADYKYFLKGKLSSEARLNVNNALEIDSVPPSMISDLSTIRISSFYVTLNWTAVGDDGYGGISNGYDIRYSESPINEMNFESAVKYENSINPKAPGSAENLKVELLDPSTRYYFAIKAVDNVRNKGPISNVINVITGNAKNLYLDDLESGAIGWRSEGLWSELPVVQMG